MLIGRQYHRQSSFICTSNMGFRVWILILGFWFINIVNGILFLPDIQKNGTKSIKLRKNNNPVIGILTQEVYGSFQPVFPEEFKSFIAASYVKFIEGAGARVVPVW